MTPALYKRALGTALIAACVLTWGTSDHWLAVTLIWAGFAAGAYLITGAVFAIFFAAALLATAYVALHDPVPPIYLVIAIVSAAICLSILTRRFRERIEATREARWKDRNS